MVYFLAWVVARHLTQETMPRKSFLFLLVIDAIKLDTRDEPCAERKGGPGWGDTLQMHTAAEPVQDLCEIGRGFTARVF